jgi:glycosyltransferase involved in cell wall biosynthesis
VVTCVPNHPRGEVYAGYHSRWQVQREEVDGMHVHRVWTYLAANKGFLKRTLGYVSYMLSAPLAALQLPRPDVIVATSPQFFCACAGCVAAKLLRSPWVFEVRDLWPESIVAVGAMRTRAGIGLLELIELLLYRDAATVVVVTSPFRENLVSRGVPPGKVHVVMNGVQLDRWRSIDVASARRSLSLDPRPFVVSYVGTLGMAHNLGTLLEAACLLKDEGDIRFLVVGDGAERESLLRQREEMGLQNLSMVGQVPREQARLYVQASDVSVVLLRKSELFKTVVPSKLFEVMAAARPIIIGVDGEARRIVEEAGAGLFVEPENAKQLAEAVLRLKSDPALRRTLGESGRRAVAERFSRPVLARQMLGVVAQVGRRSMSRRAGAWRPGKVHPSKGRAQ